MLAGLSADHAGVTTCCYFDIPFTKTLRRHATKPQAAEYGETEMVTWYRERDLLPDGREEVITADMSLDDIIEQIIRLSGLEVSALPRRG